ncbi:hypothetical protein ACWGAN_09535 [Streptomyces sp. NPDC054945]
MTANAYSFLPWLRTGIATKITQPPGAERATIDVVLNVTNETGGPGRPVHRPVQLYGPGDIVGVDPRAVSRVEPRPGITDTEPNYLAHIEFYPEDYPWRYSPDAPDPDTGRLRPWLALVVLESPGGSGGPGEFEEGPPLPDRPLPYVIVADPAACLPPAEQLGAWAHVHVNGALDDPLVSEPPDMPGALDRLREVLRTDPDQACSRLICPRHLQPNTPYDAFLVPAFETGRLTGTGSDIPDGTPATLASWGPGRAGLHLPYYHRWSFRTGPAGDFEHLVRQLKPRRPDPRVARLDVDVLRPGPGLPPIDAPAGLGGVLKLGGALRIPGREPDVWDNWDGRFALPPPARPYPHPFQEALAGLVNLADAYLRSTPAAAHRELAARLARAGVADMEPSTQVDPVITPPLYGRWHARTARLLSDDGGRPLPEPLKRNWVHRLNLDPRFRIAANFGTQVVQARQEEFMAAAWQQVGDVLAANHRIRAAQLAREIGHALQGKHLPPLPAQSPPGGARAAAAVVAAQSGRALRLTAPANFRVRTAVAPRRAGSAAGSGPPVAVGHQVATSRVAAAPLSPEMRRMMRPGARLMRALFPHGPSLLAGAEAPDALVPKMDRASNPVTAAPEKGTPSALVTPQDVADVLHPGAPPPGEDPEAQLPTCGAFRISLPVEGFVPEPGGADSEEAARFKAGLREVRLSLEAAAVGARADARDPLGVTRASEAMLTGLQADTTVPRNFLAEVRLPGRLTPFAERFMEVMAHPVIDLPMYRSLVDMSVDTFVPNLGLVPPNSVTLLAPDQEFIEAYLVGLNHEMSRELLWREFPCDQRASVFRQFWDPRSDLPQAGERPDEQRDRLYDIPAIDTWDPKSRLGSHDQRDKQSGGTGEEDDLVLVIRGELLRKYPTAVVYAHRADWARDEDGTEHRDRERVLADIPDGDRPPAHLVKLPVFEAKVEPDITLLGFDLTPSAAKGERPLDPGWFFVIEERPGDPRFGADEVPAGPLEVWNDLAWRDLTPPGARFITLDPARELPLVAFDASEDDAEKAEQRREDTQLPPWSGRLGSADLAYMLFQAPVLVAVHAQEMLLDARPAE